MEEDLKILKVEYLRKHLLDQTQILNLGLDDFFVPAASFASQKVPRSQFAGCMSVVCPWKFQEL